MTFQDVASELFLQAGTPTSPAIVPADAGKREWASERVALKPAVVELAGHETAARERATSKCTAFELRLEEQGLREEWIVPLAIDEGRVEEA